MTRSIGIVPEPPPEHGFGPGLGGLARHLWWERRWRTRFFPAELFGEPAWDLLLDLYAAEAPPGGAAEALRPHLAACVPPQTARRHVLHLEAIGILREMSAKGGRRERLVLAPDARERMSMLLAAILLQRERLPAHEGAPPPEQNPAETGAPARTEARATLVAARLLECLAELDALGLSEAGAHLSFAIASLERDALGG